MKPIQILILLLAVLHFFGCVSSDTFGEIQENEACQLLDESTLLSKSQKNSIQKFIIEKTNFDAVMVAHRGEVIYSWGDVDLPYNAASVRKSVFSALYGIAAEKGLIDLDASLSDLGVDDTLQPLSEMEKTATIRHLLQARSGIYVDALGESDGMKKRKPERGAYAPGEHFYYNNFDFNALPIILEQVTGKRLGELINDWLAIPLGMKGFHSQNVTYQSGSITQFDQTRVYISAEDLLRIGMLYLDSGRWNGVQVVPEDYSLLSTVSVSHEDRDEDLKENDFYEGYGYLWWIDDDEGTFWANGSGGQFMIVDRVNDLVVVTRNNTGLSNAGYFIYSITERYATTESANEIYKLIKQELNHVEMD